MTRPYGIDTSVLVRLLTEAPPEEFERCVGRLKSMAESGYTALVSNQVIGEAYIVLQYHYAVSKDDARRSLLQTFESGLVRPLHGASTLRALEDSVGGGVIDRLVLEGYAHVGLTTLTLDKKMSVARQAELL